METAHHTEAEASVDLVPVRLGEVWLALEADRVLEVLGQQAWAPVPGTSPLVRGVLPWRARAVAVLDLGAAIPDVPPLEEGAPRSRLTVVRTSQGTAAVPVDAVREVCAVPHDAVRPAEATAGAAREVTVDGRWMPLVDLDALADVAAGEE
ncbi:MAG: chemotaxis protein CheW, partial [Myxococcota bacterium]